MSDNMGWNDALPPMEQHGLPVKGDAQFEVLSFRKAREDVKDCGECNVAVLTLLVAPFAHGAKQEKVEDKLVLHKKWAWKLYQFFASIGQYKHGDVDNGKPCTPDWNKVVGSSGNCVVEHTPGRKEGQFFPRLVYLDENGRSRASDQPREVGGGPTFG